MLKLLQKEFAINLGSFWSSRRLLSKYTIHFIPFHIRDKMFLHCVAESEVETLFSSKMLVVKCRHWKFSFFMHLNLLFTIYKIHCTIFLQLPIYFLEFWISIENEHVTISFFFYFFKSIVSQRNISIIICYYIYNSV